jgi:hypothetical protein
VRPASSVRQFSPLYAGGDERAAVAEGQEAIDRPRRAKDDVVAVAAVVRQLDYAVLALIR